MSRWLFPVALATLFGATALYWWWPTPTPPVPAPLHVQIAPLATPVASTTVDKKAQENRADVQQWIAKQPAHLQPWLSKTAASMSKTLTVSTDAEVKALAPEISKIVQCGYQTMTEADPADRAIAVKTWIEAVEGQIGNTPERLAEYQTAQQRFHGVVTFDADPATACS